MNTNLKLWFGGYLSLFIYALFLLPFFDMKHHSPKSQLCGSGRADDTCNRHLFFLLVYHPPSLFLFYKSSASPVSPCGFVVGVNIFLCSCAWVTHDSVLTDRIISSPVTMIGSGMNTITKPGQPKSSLESLLQTSNMRYSRPTVGPQ